MLSIAKLKDASYYLDLAREDYYLEGGEPPGIWLGRGAKLLDLEGQVGKGELRHLFEGFSPDGKTNLVQNAGAKNRQAAWDLTFSAPKSVSVFWSQAPPEIRAAIQQAHFASVETALKYLEESAGASRRGHGGTERDKGVFVAAAFEHGTSRAQDPQLHTHVLVLNATIRPDGTTGSLESHPIYEAKMTGGALYRAEFATRLERDLGLEIERVNNVFELKTVPKALVDTFSTRRKEIEAALEESGFKGAKAAQVAALSTRPEKEHRARADLFLDWQSQGRDHGFSTLEVQAALHQAPKRGLFGAIVHEGIAAVSETVKDPRGTSLVKEAAAAISRIRKGQLQTLIDEGLALVTEMDSFFSDQDFIRALAESAHGKGLGIEEILAARDAALESGELIFTGEHEGERLYTTQEVLDLEQKILDVATAREHDDRFTLSSKAITKAEKKFQNLSDEQRDALSHLLRDAGGVQLLNGYAGTGKSFLFKAANFAWENAQYRVLGAAPSARAARSLQEGSNITSSTIHRLLIRIEKGYEKLTKNDILVIDEAGMVDSRTMSSLMEHIETSGAKLVLSGDSKQLQAVGIGGAFSALAERLTVKTLVDIQRQAEKWQRDAVRELADGDPVKGLQAFFNKGYLSLADDRETAMATLIEKWTTHASKIPETALLLASTRADAEELNKLAQAARPDILKGNSHERDDFTFYEGDRIKFTKNHPLGKYNNGDFGVLKGIIGGKFHIQLDSRRGQIETSIDNPNISLGYASTTHSAQGATVERAFVLLGSSMQDRNLTYVQASRARHETYFSVDRPSAGPYLRRLLGNVEASNEKEFATDSRRLPSLPALDSLQEKVDQERALEQRRQLEQAEKRARQRAQDRERGFER